MNKANKLVLAEIEALRGRADHYHGQHRLSGRAGRDRVRLEAEELEEARDLPTFI